VRVTAAVMEEKCGAFNIDTVELDTPQAEEVLIKIVATGICHTDLHARDGYFPMPYPGVYGHEGAGVIAAVGSEVEHLAPGDHVVISFPWCGECEHCHEGRRAYCRRGSELKSRGTRADGSTTLLTRGTCVLVGSARRGTEVSFEMSTLQAGRTVRGAIQGDSRPDQFIPHLVDLFVDGRFPIDRLVTFYDFAEINRAAADAVAGTTIKPVLRMPQ